MPDTTAQPRTNVLLLSVFATAALSLAMIGVYGLLSYSVAQRGQELGIRAALGGQRRDIQGLIMRGGRRLVATLRDDARHAASAAASTRP